MALLVSSWCNGVKSVPKDYIMPPDRRPGNFVTVCKDIPVIDLRNDRPDVVREIINACQEFGLFQVINHGVSDETMERIRNLYNEFFGMPVEDKSEIYSDEFGKGCRLYTGGINYKKEETHFWKDSLQHPCYPLEEQMESWPHKPARYREEVGRYAGDVRKTGSMILKVIAEGLGLEEGYFEGELGVDQNMTVNHYPACPDPSVAMGIGGHTDPNLITMLQQDHYGLQIRKDGEWMGVQPIPNAFVVNLGYQLQVISNGKLKSAEHRVVTNSSGSRTSIVTFFGPKRSLPTIVGPAKELITTTNPQIFKSYKYNHFIDTYFAYLRKPNGSPLDPFMF